VLLVVVAGVRREQPVRPARQRAIVAGLCHEMHVIRHETRGDDPEWDASLGAGEQPHEMRVVGAPVKERRTIVPAIDHVIIAARNGGSRGSRHPLTVAALAASG
jgi:hypothetical protein